MTASPERTDGFDIYKLFGHNIASEIRLQDALEDDLLCPFHYFGISDLVIDGKVMEKNLQQIGKDYNWLKKQAEKFKIKPEEALIITIDGKNQIFCQKSEKGD